MHLHFTMVKAFLPPSCHQAEHPTLSHSPFIISPIYALEKLHTSPKAEVSMMSREIWTTKKEVRVHKRGKTCLTNTTLGIDYLQVFTGIGSSERTQNRLKPILTFDWFDCSLYRGLHRLIINKPFQWQIILQGTHKAYYSSRKCL